MPQFWKFWLFLHFITGCSEATLALGWESSVQTLQECCELLAPACMAVCVLCVHCVCVLCVCTVHVVPLPHAVMIAMWSSEPWLGSQGAGRALFSQ